MEKATGRLVGTVDRPSAHILVHTGAVYLHQGELYLVTALDLDEGAALVEPGDPGYTTSARNITGIDVITELRRADVRTDQSYGGRGLKGAMKAADRSGAPYVVVIGDRDLESGVAQLKNMASGDQVAVPLDDLVSTIKEKLS